MGHYLYVSKKRYVNLLRSLAIEVQAMRSAWEALKLQLVERNAKVEDLEMKVSLLVEEDGQVGEMHDSWTTKLVKFIL